MKYTAIEQLFRKRERNKIHAKKTRERKRNQTVVLQRRIEELKAETDKLRQMIDDRYMASTLLDLSERASEPTTGIPLKHSSEICGNYYRAAMEQDQEKSKEQKVIRRMGRGTEKFSVEEKELRRRERNRMHARKTREKTRSSFELRGTIICEMVQEGRLMRQYLKSLNVLSERQVYEADLIDFKFQQQYDPLLRPTTSDGKNASMKADRLDEKLTNMNEQALKNQAMTEAREGGVNDGYSTCEDEEEDNSQDDDDVDPPSNYFEQNNGTDEVEDENIDEISQAKSPGSTSNDETPPTTCSTFSM